MSYTHIHTHIKDIYKYALNIRYRKKNDDLKADDRPSWKRKLGARRDQERVEGRVDMSKT